MVRSDLKPRSRVLALIAGIAVGVGVLYLLLPVRGVDTNPPRCYAALGYSVPCGPGWAFGAAVIAGLLAAWATSLIGRRDRDK